MSARTATAAGMATLAAGAREAIAGRVFDVATVLAAIEAESQQGRTWLRLRQQEKIDLAETKAYRRLQLRLDELGYRTRWEVVAPLPGEDVEQRYSELVVGWGREQRG